MRRLDFHVRMLQSADSPDFHKLIQSDRMSSFSSLIPDHDLNFYNRIGDAAPSFWGAFHQDRLVGTCGFAPLQIRWPFPQISTFYQSDSTVLDSFRGGACFPLLTEAQCRFFNALDLWPMGFGVENEPHTLDGLALLTKRYGIITRFIGETRLTEIYLTKAMQQSRDKAIRIHQLSKITESTKSLFLNEFSKAHDGTWQVPAFHAATLNKIRHIDPSAQLYLYGEESNPVAGLITIDISSIRRFRYMNKKSLLIEAGRSQRPFSDSAFARYKMISAPWCKPGYERQLASLIQESYAFAFEQNYDALSMRDIADASLPEALLDRVMGHLPNILHYNRRVCVMTRAKDEDVLAKSVTPQWKFDAFLV